MGPGETASVVVWSWQLEDGARVARDECVHWQLELQTWGRYELPEVAVEMTGVVEPISFGEEATDLTPRFLSVIQDGCLSAQLGSDTPLTGTVTVTGLLVPEWYGLSHPRVPATEGRIMAIRALTAGMTTKQENEVVAPGTVQRVEVDRVADALALGETLDDPRRLLGVLVDLRLSA